MTDIQLRELMKGPSDVWQRALYDEYCIYVYTIASNNLRSCGTAEDIEECVADIFIDIFRSLKSEKLTAAILNGSYPLSQKEVLSIFSGGFR